MVSFKPGDRVRVTGSSTAFPSGYPLTGAEGRVTLLYPWEEAFSEFTQYVAVELEDIETGIGNTLMMRSEYLELI